MDENKQTVTDAIGEEYKSWRAGDVILISAPTGTGKTKFIFEKLLMWVIEQYQKNADWHPIRYFVNRKLLKRQLQEYVEEKQLEEDKNASGIVVSDFITIETYQSIENCLKNNETPSLYLSRERKGLHPIINPNPVSYIVYDECHYFLADSTFNPATKLSFNYLTVKGDQEIQIFMSATMDSIKEIIEKKYAKEKYASFYPAMMGKVSHFRVTPPQKWDIKKYPKEERLLKGQYDYIHPYGLIKEDDIAWIIERDFSGYKWLIFVDKKDFGESLCSMLRKRIKKQVMFVDAEYDKHATINEQIEKSIKDHMLSCQILVCTSVLDNGFSFNDDELRNIVILADLKDEFIQMLGRKRKDENEINLYMLKWNVQIFNGRLQKIKMTRRIAEQYRNLITLTQVNPDITKMRALTEEVIQDIEDEEDEAALKEFHSLVCTYYKMMRNMQSANIHLQKLNDSILKSPRLYNHFRKFCFALCGGYCINEFSLVRLAEIESFYEKIIKSLKEDGDAFFKEQMKWLGKDFTELKLIKTEISDDDKAEGCSSISETLQQYTDVILDKNTKYALCGDIKDGIISLLQANNNDGRWDEHIADLKQKYISDERFNEIMAFLDIPYQISGPKGNRNLKRTPIQ